MKTTLGNPPSQSLCSLLLCTIGMIGSGLRRSGIEKLKCGSVWVEEFWVLDFGLVLGRLKLQLQEGIQSRCHYQELQKVQGSGSLNLKP